MASQATSRRSYGQHCAVAHALDLIGERWTMLVVRELLLGPQRYTDLLDGLPGIGTNLLARRLHDLENAGVIERQTLPRPSGAAVYALTERGWKLEPVITSLGRFGGRYLPARPEGEHLRPRWAVIALKHTFHPNRAAGQTAIYQLVLDGEVFHLRITDGQLHAQQGPAEQADLTIHTSPVSLLDLLGGLLAPADALATGTVHIEPATGDLAEFVHLFGWETTNQPSRAN